MPLSDEVLDQICLEVGLVADLKGTIAALIIEFEWQHLRPEIESDEVATAVAHRAISLLTASRSAVALAGSLLERAARPDSNAKADQRIQPHLKDIGGIASDVFQTSKRLAEIRTKLIPSMAESTVHGLRILDTSMEHLIESAKLLGTLRPAAGSVA